MTYDKPEILDFGNVADHTYSVGGPDFSCVSGCDDGGDDDDIVPPF